MLEIRNLHKSFKKNDILKGLNLKIGQGDLIYIYGKNGCGKSTLFKIISDIVPFDRGEIIFKNEAHLGSLIENPGFIENETIKFNLKFLGDLKRLYNEDYVINLCQLFDLDYANKTTLKEYSLGMRQKVGIIQAVMENQNIILFDEPTRGLDADSIIAFKELLKTLQKEGKAIIIASHDKLDDIRFTKSYKIQEGVLIEDD